MDVRDHGEFSAQPAHRRFSVSARATSRSRMRGAEALRFRHSRRLRSQASPASGELSDHGRIRRAIRHVGRCPPWSWPRSQCSGLRTPDIATEDARRGGAGRGGPFWWKLEFSPVGPPGSSVASMKAAMSEEQFAFDVGRRWELQLGRIQEPSRRRRYEPHPPIPGGICHVAREFAAARPIDLPGGV